MVSEKSDIILILDPQSTRIFFLFPVKIFILSFIFGSLIGVPKCLTVPEVFGVL